MRRPLAPSTRIAYQRRDLKVLTATLEWAASALRTIAGAADEGRPLDPADLRRHAAECERIVRECGVTHQMRGVRP